MEIPRPSPKAVAGFLGNQTRYSGSHVPRPQASKQQIIGNAMAVRSDGSGDDGTIEFRGYVESVTHPIHRRNFTKPFCGYAVVSVADSETSRRFLVKSSDWPLVDRYVKMEIRCRELPSEEPRVQHPVRGRGRGRGGAQQQPQRTLPRYELISVRYFAGKLSVLQAGALLSSLLGTPPSGAAHGTKPGSNRGSPPDAAAMLRARGHVSREGSKSLEVSIDDMRDLMASENIPEYLVEERNVTRVFHLEEALCVADLYGKPRMMATVVIGDLYEAYETALMARKPAQLCFRHKLPGSAQWKIMRLAGDGNRGGGEADGGGDGGNDDADDDTSGGDLSVLSSMSMMEMEESYDSGDSSSPSSSSGNARGSSISMNRRLTMLGWERLVEVGGMRQEIVNAARLYQDVVCGRLERAGHCYVPMPLMTRSAEAWKAGALTELCDPKSECRSLVCTTRALLSKKVTEVARLYRSAAASRRTSEARSLVRKLLSLLYDDRLPCLDHAGRPYDGKPRTEFSASMPDAATGVYVTGEEVRRVLEFASGWVDALDPDRNVDFRWSGPVFFPEDILCNACILASRIIDLRSSTERKKPRPMARYITPNRLVRAVKDRLAYEHTKRGDRAFVMNSVQETAIRAMFRHAVVVCTGPGGTGKSSVVIRALAMLREMECGYEFGEEEEESPGDPEARGGDAGEADGSGGGRSRGRPGAKTDMLVVAPTGMAARNVRQHCGIGMTIDLALVKAIRSPESMRHIRVLVVEEASACCEDKMRRIIGVLPNLVQLVLVGDVQQIGPYGRGYPMKDIMDWLQERDEASLARARKKYAERKRRSLEEIISLIRPDAAVVEGPVDPDAGFIPSVVHLEENFRFDLGESRSVLLQNCTAILQRRDEDIAFTTELDLESPFIWIDTRGKPVNEVAVETFFALGRMLRERADRERRREQRKANAAARAQAERYQGYGSVDEDDEDEGDDVERLRDADGGGGDPNAGGGHSTKSFPIKPRQFRPFIRGPPQTDDIQITGFQDEVTCRAINEEIYSQMYPDLCSPHPRGKWVAGGGGPENLQAKGGGGGGGGNRGRMPLVVGQKITFTENYYQKSPQTAEALRKEKKKGPKNARSLEPDIKRRRLVGGDDDGSEEPQALKDDEFGSTESADHSTSTDVRNGDVWFVGAIYVCSPETREPISSITNLSKAKSGELIKIVRSDGRQWVFLDEVDPITIVPGSAITINKVMGSQFESVMVVLEDNLSSHLTLNHLYTACSRPRTRLILVCKGSTLKPTEDSPALTYRSYRMGQFSHIVKHHPRVMRLSALKECLPAS